MLAIRGLCEEALCLLDSAMFLVHVHTLLSATLAPVSSLHVPIHWLPQGLGTSSSPYLGCFL